MKRTILRLIEKARLFALHDYIEAESQHKADIIGRRLWNKMNPEDGCGGISQNPYNVDASKERRDNCFARHKHLEATHAFAVETFIEEESSDAT